LDTRGAFGSGNATTASPFQSFHVSVAKGGFDGRPVKRVVKMARLTSLPSPAAAIDCFTPSSCSRRIRAASSFDGVPSTR